jgi:hypothetical protein
MADENIEEIKKSYSWPEALKEQCYENRMWIYSRVAKTEAA